MIDFTNYSLASGVYWLKKSVYDKTSSHILANTLGLILLPYSLIVGSFYIKRKKILREKIMEQASLKKIGFALVTIAKNESDYIREWVVYHKAIGVDKIYLYDNESDDGMTDLIKPFIDEGFVVVTKIYGRRQQLNANNDAVHRFGAQCKYMAFIDCDEMIMPINTSEKIIDTIDRIILLNPNAGGIAVNWCMFGSSHYDEKPDGFVCENFVWRAKTPGGKGTECIKTIAIPECIKIYKHPHYPIYRNGFFNINTKGVVVPEWHYKLDSYYEIKINHYFTKSKQEWIKRHSKGHSCMGATRNLEVFAEHDNNDVYDAFPKEYSNAIRTIFKEYKISQL